MKDDKIAHSSPSHWAYRFKCQLETSCRVVMFHVIQRSHCDFKSVIFEDGFEILQFQKLKKKIFRKQSKQQTCVRHFSSTVTISTVTAPFNTRHSINESRDLAEELCYPFIDLR